MKWLKWLALAFAFGFLMGCTSSSAPSEESVFPDDGGQTSGTFTDDAGNTMQFGPGTTLPENWPAVLPVATGELLSVSLSQDGGALATWIIADDQAQDILDGYLVELTQAGFAEPQLSGMSVPDEGVYSYDTTGNGFDVTVSAVVAEVGSELTLIATVQPADGA